MNYSNTKSILRWAALFLIMMSLGQSCAFAADRAAKASEYYEDALARMQRNDAKGAIIQLKNALQQDSKMLPALVLLGKAYLKAGQPLGADRVLADAERLGADRSEIIVSQVEVFHLLGRNKALLDRFSPDGLPPDIKYKVLITRAYAQMDVGKEPAAVQSAETARRLFPNKPDALVAESMAYLRMNNLNDAETMAQTAINVSPSDPSGWSMKASIAHVRGDPKAALEGYGKALALDPAFLDALLARASLLLDLNRNAEAARDIATLTKKFPNDPRTSYLQALLAGRQGKNDEVRKALLAAAGALDALPFDAVSTKPQLLLLGGLAQYSLGQNEKAKTYLDTFLKQYPRHMGALKLRASIMMREGRFAKAIALLEGPARAAPNDPEALSMLASCYMTLKQHSKAVALLEMAKDLNGGSSPDITANFGLSLIGSGKVDQGIAELQQAYSKGQSTTSGLPLAIMYMKENQTKPALKILQSIIQKEPDNLTALNIYGVALGLSGDVQGARQAYNDLLVKDPKFTPAILNLARLDLYEGKPEAARARLMNVLKDQPTNIDVEFELARVEMASQRPQEAIRWLEKARSFNPQNLRPNLMLVDLYLSLGDAQKALDVAQDAQSAHNDDPQALTKLGESYLALGNLEMARQNFKQISQTVGFDADWQLRAAQWLLKAKDYANARYALQKALLGKPGYLPALLLQVGIEIQAGNLDVAERQALDLASKHPRAAEVQQLLGDIAMQRSKYSEAIRYYQNAYALQKNGRYAGSLYGAYRRAGNTTKALEFARSWAASDPSNLTAARLLAEAYVAAGRLADAQPRYEALLRKLPDDAQINNTLAYIMLQRGQPGALSIAEKAYKLAPEDANVEDTYGWALVLDGQIDKGLRYLREAQVRSPNDPEIQDHLNEALKRKSQQAASAP